MRSTFKLLFYINGNKKKKNGKCPIMGRISIDGKLVQFSIQEEIASKDWSVKEGRSIGKEKPDKELNRKLEQYEQKLTKHYHKQVEENAYVTAESLKNALLKADTDAPLLLAEFKAHNEEYLKSVGITKTKGSYYSYVQGYKNLEKFITQKCELTDIAFKELQSSFIEDFEFFLRFSLNLSKNTIFNILMKLKRMVRKAINRGIIRKNPFAEFSCEPEETTRRWLSKADLDRIMYHPMANKNAEWVRILFIFSTFTGISYADLYNLKYKQVSTDETGIIWLHIRRQKTGTQAIVPLIGVALDIYNKYRTQTINGDERKVFNVPSYNLIHTHLEEIRQAAGLEILKYHQSRHTFSTTICLSNGVPIETLSRMLGHKNISTTQIYAKITNQKVDEDMQILEKRLGSKYQLPEKEVINNLLNQLNEYAV